MNKYFLLIFFVFFYAHNNDKLFVKSRTRKRFTQALAVLRQVVYSNEQIFNSILDSVNKNKSFDLEALQFLKSKDALFSRHLFKRVFQIFQALDKNSVLMVVSFLREKYYLEKKEYDLIASEFKLDVPLSAKVIWALNTFNLNFPKSILKQSLHVFEYELLSTRLITDKLDYNVKIIDSLYLYCNLFKNNKYFLTLQIISEKAIKKFDLNYDEITLLLRAGIIGQLRDKNFLKDIFEKYQERKTCLVNQTQ